MSFPSFQGVVKVVIPNSTTPLKEYIEKIKQQNQEGLITKITRENEIYYQKVLNQKSPIQQYISSLIDKRINSLTPSHKSHYIDIKG